MSKRITYETFFDKEMMKTDRRICVICGAVLTVYNRGEENICLRHKKNVFKKEKRSTGR